MFVLLYLKIMLIVFIDVNCGFCCKLYEYIDDFMKVGIVIEYLVWLCEGVIIIVGNFILIYIEMVLVWCVVDCKSVFIVVK